MIIKLTEKSWKVESSDHLRYYVVKMDELGRLFCNCKAAENRLECRHKKEVFEYLTKKI